MMVLPLLTGATTAGRVASRWAIILAGNLVGTAGFAWLITTLGEPLGVVSDDAITALAGSLTGPGWPMVPGSAVLAGWLMGLAT